MYIAGLFDIWYDENGDSMYSFTIITYESDKNFNWLHHRSPAILENEQQIQNWLDFENVPDALDIITPPKNIVWHQVSNYVNSWRNQSDQCNKPLNMSDDKKTPKKNSILNYMKKRKDIDDATAASEEPSSSKKSPKRIKKE
jgi:SOS response associated peptidase (SRAP)